MARRFTVEILELIVDSDDAETVGRVKRESVRTAASSRSIKRAMRQAFEQHRRASELTKDHLGLPDWPLLYLEVLAKKDGKFLFSRVNDRKDLLSAAGRVPF